MEFGSRQFEVPSVAVGGLLQTMVSLPVVRTALGMAAHVAIAMMGHTCGPSDVVGCVAVAGAC